jgi:dethiobiotin synthetase
LKRPPSARIVFITGSDTGVGKTVLTGLLTGHLRRSGVPVFALKPFCCGGRQDAELLQALQNKELSLDEINPFHFPEPLAPLVAARKHGCTIRPAGVLRHIEQMRQKLSKTSQSEPAQGRSKACRSLAVRHAFCLPLSSCVQKETGEMPVLQKGRAPAAIPILLIEGVGGLLVPLAERFSVLDLIRRLKCAVLVVAPNRLGTINQCLLTIEALRRARIRKLKLVLMDTPVPDTSARCNPSILSELISPVPVLRLPWLEPRPDSPRRILNHAVRLGKALFHLLA